MKKAIKSEKFDNVYHHPEVQRIFKEFTKSLSIITKNMEERDNKIMILEKELVDRNITINTLNQELVAKTRIKYMLISFPRKFVGHGVRIIKKSLLKIKERIKKK